VISFKQWPLDLSGKEGKSPSGSQVNILIKKSFKHCAVS